MNIDGLLEGMAKIEASDLHLKMGASPVMRVQSRLRPVDQPPLQDADIDDMIKHLLPDRLREPFEEEGSADFSYTLKNGTRFRVAMYHQRGRISAAFRRVNSVPPSLEELNLPEVVRKVAQANRGLILITGVTGAGKSSTMAAVIQDLNETKRFHIITLEDPIEFLFNDKHCLINQLEVGLDCRSFVDAMHRVLRFDPDVIMVGEMRDRETVETGLQAVDTGHLVLSTLHTSDAKQTITRLLHFFPKSEEKLVLEQLSLNPRACLSQRLMKSKGKEGLIPACEVLINTPIVRKLIANGRIDDIQQVLVNQEAGMQTFDQSMAELVREEKVALEEALRYASDEPTFRRLVRGEFSQDDRGGLIGAR